jgi:hypothetical protein
MKIGLEFAWRMHSFAFHFEMAREDGVFYKIFPKSLSELFSKRGLSAYASVQAEMGRIGI